MNDTLKKNLNNLFLKNRVVFWYDPKIEFEADFNEFSLDGITKLELTGENDFKVKYEILSVVKRGNHVLEEWLEESFDVYQAEVLSVLRSKDSR